MQVIELDEPVYDPNSPTGFTTGTDGYRQFGAGEWLGPWGWWWTGSEADELCWCSAAPCQPQPSRAPTLLLSKLLNSAHPPTPHPTYPSRYLTS